MPYRDNASPNPLPRCLALVLTAEQRREATKIPYPAPTITMNASDPAALYHNANAIFSVSVPTQAENYLFH